MKLSWFVNLNAGCKVYAFEAQLQAVLNLSVCVNSGHTPSSVELVGVAVTDADNTVVQVPRADALSAPPLIFASKRPWGCVQSPTQGDKRCVFVKTRRLDSVLPRNVNVKLLRIRMNGLEWLTVRGARKLFNESRIENVVFTFNPLIRGPSEAKSLLYFFVSRGFGLCVLVRIC